MDFADVAKLLWRRWYLTAPLLLLTVIAMVWMALVVKPDYKAIGNVTLIPPTVSTQAAIGTTQEVNPWEPAALAEATLIRLQSKALADSLAAQGFDGEWTVTTLDTNAPIISIEVVSPTEQQAREALSALIAVVREEVATKQEAYRLQDGEKITTLPLENSDSVEKVTTKLKRALVVVFGVGLILTIGVAVSVDAVLRRRARRQVEGAASIPAPVPVIIPPRPVVPVVPADINSTQRIAPVVVAGPATPIVKAAPAAPAAPTAPATPTAPAAPAKKAGGAVYGQRRTAEDATSPTAGGAPAYSPPARKPALPAMPAVQINLAKKPAGKPAETAGGSAGGPAAKPAHEATKPAEKPRPMPEDATIVLPLSNAAWSRPAAEPTEATKP
ncbi:capsular polysaccharide biosynthesis protein [Catenuloplanes nepalensis]|uniref:Capsular polysaccharide biosynthesis protein n=1 Tax=Catenuloplanes nepalensis TaxID=587533 RepID=A0ABT9N0Z3_9ACTN|nr:hypothetical protein [Catenuloplanes nepalensis]MDP9797353.1 capsular polysaccharide biosynthesis protein [Catenuloplanes nepalensis]